MNLLIALIVWILRGLFLALLAVARWFGLPGTATRDLPTPGVGLVRGSLRSTCAALLIAGVALISPENAEQKARARAATMHERELALPAVGSSFRIDVADSSYVLRDFTSREVADQLRDWAVLGTLTRLGLPAEKLAQATVGTVPMRFPYLEEMFPFEYGRGRRAIVESGDGARILLFFEADEPDPVATLGRLADRVRMELGELPASVELFEITPALAEGAIHVTRRPSLMRAQLFGAEYGYRQAEVHDLAEFERWLGSVDDVVWAQNKGRSLVLGGRRFERTRERTVTLEDVAVLYRAQVGARAEQRKLELALEAAWKEHTNAFGMFEADGQRVAFEREVERIRASRESDPEPGFSLDPTWRIEPLTVVLEAHAKSPCLGALALAKVSGLRAKPQTPESEQASVSQRHAMDVLFSMLMSGGGETCRELDRVVAPKVREIWQAVAAAHAQGGTAGRRAAAKAADALAYLHTDGQLTEAAKALTQVIADQLRATQQVQCARYDGPREPTRSLRGTRVGMNLFYTDLLAKLWVSLDYKHSAPSLLIAGFQSQPLMDLEPEWAKEQERLRYTRLWFGPKREAHTRAEDDSWIALRHTATRVFAAGSSHGLNGQREEQPSEASRRSFGWWDRHYDDVAEFEPEYALQNQIMKWSVLTEWMAAHSLAPYLDDPAIAVRRDWEFDHWHASSKEPLALRFAHAIELRPRREWVSGTECMDLLGSRSFESVGASWTVEGGVSLAGQSAAKAAPRLALHEPASLRFLRSLGSEEVGANVGTSIKVLPKYAGNGRVVAQGGEAARLRWAGRELPLGKALETSVRPIARGAVTEVRASQRLLGALKARQRGDDVVLAWEESALHAEQRALALGDRVAPQPKALELGDPDLLVKLEQTAGSNVKKAVELLSQTRAKALEEGRLALAQGDLATAAARFRAGHVATPELTLQRALLHIESGAIARGQKQLAQFAELPADVLKTPLVQRLRVAGLDDLEAQRVLQGERVAVADGQLSLHAEPGRSTLVLHVERPLPGRVVELSRRPQLVEQLVSEQPKDHQVLLYLDDSFSLNQQDLAAIGDGAVAELAQQPKVLWEELPITAPLFEPERIVTQGVTYQLVPAPRRARLAAANATYRNVVIVRPQHVNRRCDPSPRSCDPSVENCAPQLPRCPDPMGLGRVGSAEAPQQTPVR